VKLSEDDIAWLYPGRLQEEVAAEWLSMGVDLVVITLGSEGLLGITRQGSVKVPGVKITVADTVGAGDTVGAILVEGVVKYGVAGLIGETLKEVLTRAAAAAAITCSRAGAQPPYLHELDK
jgi:fructokinase